MAFGRRGRIALLVSLSVVLAIVVLENVVVARLLSHLERVPADVSPAYLRYALGELAASPPQILFFGDSVVWGYRLPAGATAVASLAARGCPCRNLALRAGSPPSDYGLERLIEAAGIRPKQVVLEVDLKALNPVDADYKRLLPGVAEAAGPLLSPADLALLEPAPETISGPLERTLSSWWLLYGMRADLRDLYFGGERDAPFVRPTPELYEGTYDLTPLGDANVGVHFLERTVDALHRARIPVLAFLTPTNHTLLHDYIDGRGYRANVLFVQRALARRGARVVNFDRAFPAALFIDNTHLTAAGQRRLAERLAPLLRR
jgi:hypothetical protein